MKINNGLENLAYLLSMSLRNLDFENRIKEQSCIMFWDEVVGEKVAGAAQPEFVRDGKLFVTAKSSVWANELTFYKTDIIERLNKRVGGWILNDIVFKSGRIKRRKPLSVENPSKNVNLEGIELTKAELDKVDTAVAAACEAGDSLKNLMMTSIRLEKWKESQGWTPCKRCGSLQNTDKGICPPCQLG